MPYDAVDAPYIFKRYKKRLYFENVNAFSTADSKDLQDFLQYVKTGKVTTDYTGRKSR